MAEQPSSLLRGERRGLDQSEVPAREVRLERRAPEAVAPGEQELDRGPVQPPSGERQRLERTRVGPVDVVHEHHDPLVCGQARQHVVDADVDQLRVDGVADDLPQQNGRQCVPHGPAQVVGVEVRGPEQVVQHPEGAALLALARRRPEDHGAAVDREVRGVLPEGGLARAWLADEHEAVRPTGTEELVQRRDLAIAPDEAFPSAHDGTLTLGDRRAQASEQAAGPSCSSRDRAASLEFGR